jgi:6-phosphogluconolactonase (cycloisomerase 2 family)
MNTIRRSAISAFALALMGGTALADQFVYTNDNGSPNTVTTFRAGTNGNLTKLGTTSTNGTGCGLSKAASENIASANGDLLLVGNSCSSNVTVFKGASSGKLTFVSLLPVPNTYGHTSIASDGKCVVFGSYNSLSSFILPNFTPVNTVSVDIVGGGGIGIKDMKIAKSRSSSYVVVALGRQVEVVTISHDCTFGASTKIPTAVEMSKIVMSTGVDFSPRGDILYVGDFNPNRTIVEAFNFPSGAPLPGSPYIYFTGADSNVVLASKDGKCLFVSNQYSQGVTSIPLNSGVPGSTATLYPTGTPGSAPSDMASDVAGKMFFVASFSPNQVTTEIIGDNCSLTMSPNGPVNTGANGLLESLTTSH